MSLSESLLIQRFFNRPLVWPQSTALGVGDDAALLHVPAGYELATSIDTLVEGVHFPLGTDAFDIGFKSLAVSVSDIAAMGAEPRSALLSLTLEKQDLAWLERFSAGFFSLANKVKLDLVGGDLSRGPLSVTTVVNGFVPSGTALTRRGAKVGDRIYVTGSLGDAACALYLLNNSTNSLDDELLNRLNRPNPRVEAGLLLRGVANSAMDVSDGLMLDLERLCQQSGVAGHIYAAQLPLSSALRQAVDLERALLMALSGGDDYELLFTASKTTQVPAAVQAHCIGEIVAGSGVVAYDAKGQIIKLERFGYDHFN